MKTQIEKIVSTFNPKSFGKIISSDPILYIQIKHYIIQNNLENIAEAVFCIHHDTTPVNCPCGKKALFNSYNKGYRKFCSFNCPEKGMRHAFVIEKLWENTALKNQMLENKKKTTMLKYGVENAIQHMEVQKKIAATNIEKYGCASPLGNAEVQQKIKKTLFQNHGVEFPFQSESIRKKSKETFFKNHGVDNDMSIARNAFTEKHGKNPFQMDDLKQQIKEVLVTKYGVDHPMKCQAILEKSKNTLFGHYGKTNPAQLHIHHSLFLILQSPELLSELLNSKSIVEITKEYGCSRSLIINYHNRHGLDIIKQRARSGYEEEIAKVLNDIGISFLRNSSKICPPKQIDFFIPAYSLAIEFNGLYWHAERSGSKNKDYHVSKFLACKQKNIQLLTIFEDEWLEKPETIISKIKHLCGKTEKIIGARKIKLSISTKPDELRDFLNNFHLQGRTEGVSLAILGKFENNIVSCLTLRNNEITRFCTDTKASYPGLFSKFLKFIRKNTQLKTLTTIADLRWGVGDVYLKAGFTQVGEIKPDYQYTDYHSREHKFNYRKDKIAKKYGIPIIGKTEKQLTEELGLDRIWDCGKLKFEMIM